jgi:hypothetical protein
MAFAAALLAAPAQAQSGSADVAKHLLKAMSDYMSAQQSLSGEFDAEIDVVTPDIEKIQFSSTGTVLLARPDKIRFVRKGGNIDVHVIFDGKMLTLVDGAGSAYSRVAAPGTIENAIGLLRRQHRVEMPATDPLLVNSYDILMKGVLEAKHIGTEVIEGVECEHLAFRDTETDWQLWVRKGSEPLPCKYIISSKTVAASPEYTVRYRNWTAGEPVPPTAFGFNPAKTAKAISFDEMSANSGLLAATATTPEMTGEP